MPATAAEQTPSRSLVLLCIAAWAVPGAGHLWLGRTMKGMWFWGLVMKLYPKRIKEQFRRFAGSVVLERT